MKKNGKRKRKPNPDRPLTDAEWQSLGKPMKGIEGLPSHARTAVRRMGRPPLAHPKEKITIRLDQDVIKALRAMGKGWQTKVNRLLREHVT